MRLRNVLAILLVLLAPLPASARQSEGLWYTRNNDEGVRSFVEHADRISVVSPQVFAMDSLGRITGGIDARIVAAARAHGVKLVPLVMNPGFSLGVLHRILTDADARATAVHSLAALCRDQRLDGIQLDFENLHVSDRDAFTAFAREAVDSVHRAGCTLSAAVVPRTDDVRGPLPYHQWMYDYWRGAYDYKALSDTLDFISYMTYAQHGGSSTPGPVAGFPWMEASLRYLLALGVPPSKVSLGVPAYSDYWYPGWDAKNGARPQASDISYPALMSIIEQAGARPEWDKVQRSWRAMWERNGVFEHAWLEDARAFREKVALVKRHHLRGYSVWLLGLEDPRVWSVVESPTR
jgi:spore germination protein YaaH